MRIKKYIGAVLGLLVLPLSAHAGDVKVVDVKASKQGDSWTFDVTLEHEDSGWEHYADAWRVVSDDGKEYGTRTLFHPHENEQPFTRSQSGIKIPADVTTVYVEAHDKVHGWSPDRFKYKLPN